MHASHAGFLFCLNVKWLPNNNNNNNNNRNLPTFIPFRHYLQPTILLLRKEEERDWIHGHALTQQTYNNNSDKKKKEKIFPLSSLNLFVPFKFLFNFPFPLILILLSSSYFLLSFLLFYFSLNFLYLQILLLLLLLLISPPSPISSILATLHSTVPYYYY